MKKIERQVILEIIIKECEKLNEVAALKNKQYLKKRVEVLQSILEAYLF